jgi:hypothetical protein
MTKVATWRSNNTGNSNDNSFITKFCCKKLCCITSDIRRKYRLVIHRWICLDLLITEQFNLLKSDKNWLSKCILYKFSVLLSTFQYCPNYLSKQWYDVALFS